jgi:hypothetical protein
VQTTVVETPEVVTPVIESGTNVESANDFFKREFNWDSIDVAKQEIERLKSVKPSVAEQVFANEQTKKIYDHLKLGDLKSVKEYLQAQELLENLDTSPDEDKLKLYIQMQNPRFDKELVDDEYSSIYQLDEDSISDPMQLRKEKLRLEQRIENDEKKAQEIFTQYRAKIELPEIHPTATVDEGYEAFKASNAKAEETYNNIVVPTITSLKETDIPLSFSINDEKNKMNFEVNIIPESTDFEVARQDSLDLDLLKTCYDKDGVFLPAKLQRLNLIARNFDKYAQSIARQAVNAERARVIASETTGSGGQRDFNVVSVEPTELQKMERMAFG